jgi:hypothetical protein
MCESWFKLFSKITNKMFRGAVCGTGYHLCFFDWIIKDHFVYLSSCRLVRQNKCQNNTQISNQNYITESK